jgi:integrase
MKISKVNGRPKPWSFRIPPRLSDTGKYETRYFATKEEAQYQAQRIENMDPDSREILATFTPTNARDFALAERLVQEKGGGRHLIEIVRLGLRVVDERLPSKIFADACDDYIAIKGAISAKYGKSLRATKSKFAYLAEKEIQDLGSADFWRVLKTIPESTRSQHMRHLRAILNYALKKEFLRKNPMSPLDIPKTARRGEVEIYEPATVAKLLQYTLDYDLDFLPFLVFGFFCGVRPSGELTKLEWRSIDWERKRLNLPASVAKGGRFARQIEICDSALIWLNAYRARGGSTDGKILKLSERQLRDCRTAARKLTGIDWIQDGMRHSFASYHVAMYEDTGITALRMGHLGTMVLQRHYLAGIPKETAAQFWAIRPAEIPANLIAFGTQR